MKKIRLIDLRLRNFRKGTGALSVNGMSADVLGENETGKTTFVDAYFWLLTDKNSLGQSKFDIKTRDEDWNEMNGLEHEVVGIFDVDGERVELKKVYHELWEKKRGAAKPTFTGHTTDYYVDSEGVAEKVYKERVSAIIGDPVVFSLVTNPSYLTEMTTDKDWSKARKLLMDYFGTITEEDVLNSSDEMRGLKDLLGKKTVDAFKTIVHDKQVRINEDLQKIPVRIDEQTRMMPDVTGLDLALLRSEVEACETVLSDAKLRLSGIDTGGSLAEASKRLTVINTDIAKIENTHRLGAIEKVTKLDYEISDLRRKKDDQERRAAGIAGDIRVKEQRIADTERRLASLREEWLRIDAEEFTDGTPDTCPACGQALPDDRVQDARDKALADFNRKKAERLEEITTKGRCCAADVTRDREGIEHLRTLDATTGTHDDEIVALTAQRDALKAAADDFSLLPGRDGLIAQRDAVEAQIRAEKEGKQTDRGKIEQMILSVTAQLDDAKARAELFPAREKGEQRIEQLKAEEKKLAKEYEELERQKFLCEKFTKLHAEMVSTEINRHFKLVRWQLFETQVNQGIKPVCLATIKAGTYGRGLNDGNKINAGLDICMAFSKATGLEAPIFIDRAETVTNDFESDMQVVKFIAKKGVKTLQIQTRPEGTLFGKRAAA